MIDLLQDAHLHIECESELNLSDEISRIFLNSTNIRDIHTISENAERLESVIPFFGVHPWNADSEFLDRNAINDALIAFPQAGVGECGLDFNSKFKKKRLNQITAFEAQLKIAYELQRPLSIHSVRAWGHTIESLKKYAPFPKPFILHSFYGSQEIAEIIITLGGYLSLSNISIKNPEYSFPIIASIPTSRILIESDMVAGDPNFSVEKHLHSLKKIYNTVSEIKSADIDDFKLRISENGTVFTN